MADILYAAKGASETTSDLYEIDPVTCVATAVGPIGFALTGLAQDRISGVLYGCTSNNSAANPRAIIEVDPVTGAGSLIGNQFATGTRNLLDICCDSAGALYGWIGPSGGPAARNQLGAVNKSTGLVTPVGASGLLSTFGGGLDFDSGGVLHACLDNVATPIYTVDPVTGVATSGPTTTGDPDDVINSASFTVDGLTFYIILHDGTAGPGNDNRLATLDTSTGTIVTIGALIDDLDALAWFATAAPPPPPPPLDTGKVRNTGVSRIFVTSKTGRTLSILDRRATNRQFLFTLNAPAYHTGQVASDDNEINQAFPNADDPSLLTHNRRLMYWLRRETRATVNDAPYVCRFGGIVMALEDDGADAPTTRYTAYDPWQYMMSRPVRDDVGALPGIAGLKYPPGSRASDIAVDLLVKSEIFDGETHIETGGTAFPLVETSDPLTYGIRFDQGLSVGEAWQQLVATGTIDIHLPPLYDPINSPGKVCEFEVVKQVIGEAAGPVRFDIVMSWDGPGHSLMSISRMVDGTRLANSVQYFAGQGGVKVPLQTDAASIAAYGTYFAQQFFPGTHDRTTVALLAVAALAIRRDGIRSITLDPAPERVELALRDYREGDYLPIWASRNLREPIGVDYDTFDPDAPGACGYQRVYTIPIELDDNGVERVRGLLVSKDSVIDS